MVATTHHGEFTWVTIASKPVDENSAQMRFILFNGSLGQEEDEDGMVTGVKSLKVTETVMMAVTNWKSRLRNHMSRSLLPFTILGDEWELIYINENVPNDWIGLTIPPRPREKESDVDYRVRNCGSNFRSTPALPQCSCR